MERRTRHSSGGGLVRLSCRLRLSHPLVESHGVRRFLCTGACLGSGIDFESPWAVRFIGPSKVVHRVR